MMRFASLFGVLQSSALKTAIVKKKRRENLFIPIKTANFADRIYKVVSMSKTLYSLALSSVISLDIAAMSLPPHFSAGSGMAKLGGTGCHRGKVTSDRKSVV